MSRRFLIGAFFPLLLLFGVTLRVLIRHWLLDTSSRTAHESPESTDDNSVSLIYTISKETLEAQPIRLNSLETKAGTLIAFAGGIFALLMGARETLVVLPRASQVLILVSVAIFAVSVVLAFVVTWVHRSRTIPDLEVLAEGYLNSSSHDTKLQLIANSIPTWKANHYSIERNADFLRFAFLTQTIAFILLGMALFVSFP
jgi:hypothetical protein